MKRNESTNDKILRLYNEGWEPEQIAEEVTIPVGSVNSILERRIEGYAEILAKKSLEANKARTAAKEEALRKEREAQEALEAKQAKYSSAPKKTSTIVNPDDFFNSDLDGMLVGSYKEKLKAPEEEHVNILTADENTNILTEDFVEETAEEVVEETAEEIAPTPVVENPTASVSQKLALFAQAQIAENESKIEAINAEIEKISNALSQSESAVADTNAQIDEISQKIADLNSQLAEINAQIANLETEKADLSAKAQDNDIAELNSKIAGYNEQITALKAENEQFREMM